MSCARRDLEHFNQTFAGDDEKPLASDLPEQHSIKRRCIRDERARNSSSKTLLKMATEYNYPPLYQIMVVYQFYGIFQVGVSDLFRSLSWRLMPSLFYWRFRWITQFSKKIIDPDVSSIRIDKGRCGTL